MCIQNFNRVLPQVLRSQPTNILCRKIRENAIERIFFFFILAVRPVGEPTVIANVMKSKAPNFTEISHIYENFVVNYPNPNQWEMIGGKRNIYHKDVQLLTKNYVLNGPVVVYKETFVSETNSWKPTNCTIQDLA